MATPLKPSCPGPDRVIADLLELGGRKSASCVLISCKQATEGRVSCSRSGGRGSRALIPSILKDATLSVSTEKARAAAAARCCLRVGDTERQAPPSDSTCWTVAPAISSRLIASTSRRTPVRFGDQVRPPGASPMLELVLKARTAAAFDRQPKRRRAALLGGDGATRAAALGANVTPGVVAGVLGHGGHGAGWGAMAQSSSHMAAQVRLYRPVLASKRALSRASQTLRRTEHTRARRPLRPRCVPTRDFTRSPIETKPTILPLSDHGQMADASRRVIRLKASSAVLEVETEMTGAVITSRTFTSSAAAPCVVRACGASSFPKRFRQQRFRHRSRARRRYGASPRFPRHRPLGHRRGVATLRPKLRQRSALPIVMASGPRRDDRLIPAAWPPSVGGSCHRRARRGSAPGKRRSRHVLPGERVEADDGIACSPSPLDVSGQGCFRMAGVIAG